MAEGVHQMDKRAVWIEMDEETFQLARAALELRAQTWGGGHPNKRRDNLAAIRLSNAWAAAQKGGKP